MKVNISYFMTWPYFLNLFQQDTWKEVEQVIALPE